MIEGASAPRVDDHAIYLAGNFQQGVKRAIELGGVGPCLHYESLSSSPQCKLYISNTSRRALGE